MVVSFPQKKLFLHETIYSAIFDIFANSMTIKLLGGILWLGLWTNVLRDILNIELWYQKEI